MLADLAIVLMLVGVTAYVVLAGADFGAGFWDLIAGNQDRVARPRALVDYALATRSCDCECSCSQTRQSTAYGNRRPEP